MAEENTRAAVGGSHKRIDTYGKVTGETRYVEDMVLPDMLYARVFRSPHHHARLLSLETAAAARLPGVVRIITAADIPGLNGLDGYSKDEPVLTAVGDTVRQRGAAIALVVAEAPAQARAALAAIQADYEVLPHVFEADDALRPGAPQIYPAGNVLNHFEVRQGDIDAAFAASDVVLDTAYHTASQEHATLERDATLAYLDADGCLTVLGGTHEPHWQQGWIGQTVGLDAGKVRVICPPTGGSFGNRQDPWPLVAAGLAAYLVRRPVRLALSRGEVFDATPKRHPYDVRFRVGATAAGRLTGFRVRVDANTGGYDSGGYWIPNYAVTGSGGAYLWPAVDAYAQAVYTNAAKCGQFRGYGAPQSTFALECTLDELCQQLDLDPLEFRLANRIQQDSVTFLGYPVGESLGYEEVLTAARPRFKAYQEEAAAFNAAHAGGPQRMGVGFSGMWYRFGKSGSLRVETHAELAADGHFVIYCSAPDYGQGIATVMLQLAAETLAVPRDRVEIVNADTGLTPDSGIQGASRATYFTGASVQQAAANLRDEILGVAAEILDCAPAGLALRGDEVAASDGSAGVSLREVAAEFDRLGKSRRVIGLFDLSPLFPEETRPDYIPLFITGAQVAQVILDTETGQVQVTRVLAVHDVGQVINRPGAEGQVQGAVLMGVGSALMEEYVPGATTGFINYILPMAGTMPEIEVILIEVPSYHGPLGAKGLGEVAIMPTAPAIINALSRAAGVRLRELPATPARVLAAMAAARGRGA